MKNNQLVLLKLGGSLITDKSRPFTARREVIVRLGREIKSALAEFNGRLIIAHGSGSFGHSVAKKYGVEKGWEHKRGLGGVPLVADAAAKINRIVVEELLKAGLPVVSFAPASLIFADNSRPADIFLAPISQCLNWEMIPVLYGDVIFDQKRGWCIFSSEKILNILAKSFRRDFSETAQFYCGDTNGVYDESGTTIEVITQKSFKKIRQHVGGSKEADVTGGMLHKIQEAITAAVNFDVETVIFNGNVIDELKKALTGEAVNGTMIVPG